MSEGASGTWTAQASEIPRVSWGTQLFLPGWATAKAQPSSRRGLKLFPGAVWCACPCEQHCSPCAGSAVMAGEVLQVPPARVLALVPQGGNFGVHRPLRAQPGGRRRAHPGKPPCRTLISLYLACAHTQGAQGAKRRQHLRHLVPGLSCRLSDQAALRGCTPNSEMYLEADRGPGGA